MQIAHPLVSLVVLASTPALADPITTLPPTEFTWERTPEGVAFASLKGDRFTESYLAMVELPAGLVSPAHTKSADMFGVVVQGVMIHQSPDGRGAGIELPEGAYYYIPADLPHISSCVSADPCVTFLYQNGAFDFLPVAE